MSYHDRVGIISGIQKEWVCIFTVVTKEKENTRSISMTIIKALDKSQYPITIFFFFWLHWVFVAVHGLSLVVVTGGYSSLWCTGFSLWWLLLVVEHRL